MTVLVSWNKSSGQYFITFIWSISFSLPPHILIVGRRKGSKDWHSSDLSSRSHNILGTSWLKCRYNIDSWANIIFFAWFEVFFYLVLEGGILWLLANSFSDKDITFRHSKNLSNFIYLALMKKVFAASSCMLFLMR